ncbi:hypothetical protein lbkm_0703 [Lachnospiraceae bacterium KM106-2]|nr:hypothetical protein lbkm_0703 [Lachnospiraceae bacterium KM106-2]
MEKRTKGKEGHIDSYEIRNQTTVKRIRKILHEADWSTCKAKPKTSPDYQFCFQFVSKNYEAKAVLYEVWILKNGDQLYIESGGYESTIIKQDLAADLIDLLNH